MKKMWNIAVVILLIMLIPTITFAEDTENILEEQKNNFGIKEFLKETEEYSPDFIKELNINDIFENAIKGNIDNSNFFRKILGLIRK